MKKIIEKSKPERKIKKEKLEKRGIFYSLIGYFVGVFVVNLASKNISLNPIFAIETFGYQISTLISLPRVVFVSLGFLLTLVPMILVYFLYKEYKRKKKSFI